MKKWTRINISGGNDNETRKKLTDEWNKTGIPMSLNRSTVSTSIILQANLWFNMEYLGGWSSIGQWFIRIKFIISHQWSRKLYNSASMFYPSDMIVIV